MIFQLGIFDIEFKITTMNEVRVNSYIMNILACAEIKPEDIILTRKIEIVHEMPDGKANEK
jgi:hypothetical protein